jgi:16S rRNA (cytosine1402-N4)-methyltransferase
MMAGGDGFAAVAGGPAPHIPVLIRPALDFLHVRDGGVYVDGTFGAGGYARAILAAADCRVIAIDRDPTAVAGGADLVAASQGRLTLFEERFSGLERVARAAGHKRVDGVVFDLGVSSMQLDRAARGFSFRHDGPLDMRMGASGASAADVVNAASEGDLADIVYGFGEERRARAIARAIVRARGETPIRTTGALAAIVAAVVRARPGDIHPATRTFQALRIFVNDELGELSAALAAAERLLKEGGRLVVISFHSLEDRMVKTFMTARASAPAGSRHAPERKSAAPSMRLITRRPVIADAEEIARNPRARSAKLRAAERTAALAHPPTDLAPRLPALADVLKGR